MDLGLEISPTLLGRSAQPLTADIVRELRIEDLELLNMPRQVAQQRPLARLSERHHALARLLATGVKPGDAAAVMSYSFSRVSILQADPAFQELIRVYRSTLANEMRSNFERLSGLAADASDLLAERMENEPEKVSTGQLIEITKLGADRSGNGPQSSSVQLNINVGIADRMKKAREAARAASEPLQIEGNLAAAE